MKILHIANFNLLTTKGCSQNSMQIKITNGLIRAGHNVVTYSDRDMCRLFGFGHMNFWGRKKVNQHLIQFCMAIKPDAIFLGHADTIKTETLQTIKSKLPDIKILDWNVDNIVSVAGQDVLSKDAEYTVQKLKKKASVSDLILVTTADKRALMQLKTDTNNVGFLPNIADKSIESGRAFEYKDLPYDLLFAATPTLQREFCGQFESVDTIATEIMNHIPSLNPLFAGLLGNGKIHAEKYQSACAGCAMGLSLSHINSVRLYQSDRLAHLMGNGVLTFLDEASGYRDFFSDNEIAFYKTPQELYQKIAYFKQQPDERMRVAKAGYERYYALFNEVTVAEYMLDLLFHKMVDSEKYPWGVAI